MKKFLLTLHAVFLFSRCSDSNDFVCSLEEGIYKWHHTAIADGCGLGNFSFTATFGDEEEDSDSDCEINDRFLEDQCAVEMDSLCLARDDFDQPIGYVGIEGLYYLTSNSSAEGEIYYSFYYLDRTPRCGSRFDIEIVKIR